jgi:predicted peptidase
VTDRFPRTALLLGLATTLFAACAPTSQFLERGISIGDQVYRYRVWLPPHYTKLHHWPVILFLHGSGERGEDNLRQVSVGLGPALQRFGDRYKVVVVFPQCRLGQEWYGDMELQALAALEKSIGEFHGDRRRIYLTGVSMGGAGVWYMARHRRRFAAVVPVCGEVVRQPDDPFPTELPPDIARIAGARDPYAALAAAIGTTPVWAFHGSSDDVIPVSESRNMVAALQRAGGLVHYTEYPNVGHDCWDPAYADADMVRWLLQQRLR